MDDPSLTRVKALPIGSHHDDFTMNPTPRKGEAWDANGGIFMADRTMRKPRIERDQDLLDRVERAIDSDDILRQMVGDALRIDVEGRRVTLRGHVFNSAHKSRAEALAHSVAGVIGVDNQIVDDLTLLQEVSLAITSHPVVRTYGLRVDIREGIVEVSGTAPSLQAVEEIEATIAQVPQVRGIANHLASPPVPAWWKTVIQPAVGAAVYATDRGFGIVRAVIINSRRRRVDAIVVDGDFPPPGTLPFADATLDSGS